MSLSSSLFEGMAEVASTAMLTHSISQQGAALDQAHDAVRQWMVHSRGLEERNAQLQQTVNRLQALTAEQSVVIADLVQQRDRVKQKSSELQTQLDELQQSYTKVWASAERSGEMSMRQLDYTRDLKQRLAATEKALQHSSSRSVAMQDVCDYLKQVTAALDNHSEITQRTQEIMEKAYQNFVLTGHLTPDEEMQAILDELKIKAPNIRKDVYN